MGAEVHHGHWGFLAVSWRPGFLADFFAPSGSLHGQESQPLRCSLHTIDTFLHQLHLLPKMACHVEPVPALSLDEIAHQVHTVLERQHPSPVRHWLNQALITVMARHPKDEIFSL